MYVFHQMVEFEDVDSYGIMHHPIILYYLERARARLLVDHGMDIQTLPWGVVIKSLSVNYKGKLEMFNTVVLELRAKDVERFSFKWDYIVRKDDKIVTTASVETVIVDRKTKNLIPIPDDLLAILNTIRE